MPHGPKKTTRVFGSETHHDELISLEYLFCSNLLLFSRKFAKIVQDADHYKNGGHKCRKYEHKNFARENCKSMVAFGKITTSANNRILESSLEPKLRSKSLCSEIILNKKNHYFKLTL